MTARLDPNNGTFTHVDTIPLQTRIGYNKESFKTESDGYV